MNCMRGLYQRLQPKMTEKGGYEMNPDEIVCTCVGVTAGMIKEAVEAGARTVEEVQAATNAGTVCGACLGNVEELIRQFTPQEGR